MNRIYRTIAALAALLMISAPLRADEGMWLPVLISQRIADMQAKGCRLSAEDIYSVNQASLKDAVILFGSGCTGEVVSDKGLLFTNHHCGYSFIQRHSSVEHDYLKDGFWAMSNKEELPCPGLTVKFLERMVDVSAIVLKDVRDDMSEQERAKAVAQASAAIISDAVKDGKGLKASVEPLFYGNQYFLYVFREYSDIRFVGAPPSSIGKFGGDTDNWMWPRHTGDFSIFRIYADKDNNPAAYSEDNIPYTPKKYFKVSRAGVKEGDFTFIYGCPGSTREYVHSSAVEYVQNFSDPVSVGIRTQRLEIIKKYQDQSPELRIKYSAKAQRISNAWKKWQGEVKGLKRNHIVEKKLAFEQGFEKWAQGTPYAGVTKEIETVYGELSPLDFAYTLFQETAATVELASFATNIHDNLAKNGKVNGGWFYRDYHLPVDKECFVAVMKGFAEHMPEALRPQYYVSQLAEYGSVEAWADALFSKTLFADPDKVNSLTAADIEAVEKDPMYVFAKSFAQWVKEDIIPYRTEPSRKLALLNRKYMKGQMEYQPDKAFYPDANLTLRVAYGNIKGYAPYDGAYYYPVSTLKGIIQKDNPDIFDYNIPQTLRDIYAEGGHESQPVCFLATNHTTGGNSGSPVLDADGNLIGINFDRVWEGTMSDLAFDPLFCRNISLDVRYLLFVIDRIGGASYLFNEMSFAD